MGLEMVSRIMYFITFPGIKGKLTSLYYLRSSSLLVLKTEEAFPSFQSSRTFPDHYYRSEIIQNDLTVTSVSYLSTWWVHPVRPQGFMHINLLKCSLNLSSCIKSKSSMLKTFPQVLLSQDS